MKPQVKSMLASLRKPEFNLLLASLASSAKDFHALYALLLGRGGEREGTQRACEKREGGDGGECALLTLT